MAAFASYAAAALAAATSAGSIEGQWMHPDRSVIMRVEPCGEAMCGTVIWASQEAKRDARGGVDHLVGARLLTGFHRNTKGVWKGKIFVPDYGMHVSGKIQPMDGERLKVSGCAFGGILCRTQIWTRSGQPVSASD